MTAFVLGNGVGRRGIDINHLLELGAVYACNAVYREHTVTALVATDDKIARAIEASGYPARARFHTRRPVPGTGSLQVPRAYHGFSSGPIAVALAALDQHPEIYLLGFDMAAEAGRFNNVYAGTEFYKPPGADPTYTGNWQRQLIRVMQDHAQAKFIRVMAPTTADIAELNCLANHAKITRLEFQALINKQKESR
jgi:hypothetical protein